MIRAVLAIIAGLLGFAIRSAAVLARFGVHHPLAGLITSAVFIAAVLFRRTVLSRHAQGWRRARSIRFRLWLRLRPGAGFASLPELGLRWGRLAALSYGRRSRPGLGLRDRLTRPATDYAVRLGRAQYFRRLYAAMELQLLILAPPRTDKTGLLADRIISHPGPVLTTSTRPDLHLLTSTAREDQGPPFVFNPEGTGDVPSTFAWDLLGACTDELMAYRVADWLAGATPGYGDLAWFEEQGTVGMSGLLLAAARTGATVAEVYQWVQRRGQERGLQALAEHGNGELYAVVRALMEENRTAASVRSTIARALKWAVIPQLASAASRSGTFSAREFLLGGGTLHLIASGDSRSVITPLVRALASYIHFQAGLVGSRSEHGRLDPPLLMAMDEVAQVCPVDLPSMLADSAGKGILFVTVAHSLAKLEERWGKEGAGSIWAISGVKMLLRGITEPQTLEDVSRVCGTLGGDGDDKTRIVPPEVLRCLPKHCALVINMNLSPVVVKVRAAWKRRGYRRLSRRAGLYVPPWRLDEAAPVLELPGFAAGAAPETAPVPASANGHGGTPGPLARAEP
jgi:hypothetical protein